MFRLSRQCHWQCPPRLFRPGKLQGKLRAALGCAPLRRPAGPHRERWISTTRIRLGDAGAGAAYDGDTATATLSTAGPLPVGTTGMVLRARARPPMAIPGVGQLRRALSTSQPTGTDLPDGPRGVPRELESGGERLCESAESGAGEIQLILGPMFSGKSTEMLRRIRRHGYAQQRCLIVKNAADTRHGSDGFISTHDTADQAKATSVTALLVQ